jgi:hypothetical protein
MISSLLALPPKLAILLSDGQIPIHHFLEKEAASLKDANPNILLGVPARIRRGPGDRCNIRCASWYLMLDAGRGARLNAEQLFFEDSC